MFGIYRKNVFEYQADPDALIGDPVDLAFLDPITDIGYRITIFIDVFTLLIFIRYT